MKNHVVFYVATTLAAAACGHQQPLPSSKSPSEEMVTWLSKYGKQIDQPFSGPLAFSHAEYARCLEDESAVFDIAILGMPFDTGTSYRPGARFGPYAIRSGSRRQRASRGYTLAWGDNPYASGSKILDCGDVCLLALGMILPANSISISRSLPYLLTMPLQSTKWKSHTLPCSRVLSHQAPLSGLAERFWRKMVASIQESSGNYNYMPFTMSSQGWSSLGGDHTIVLPILRALNKVYGPISVIHFDAHLDTWNGYPGAVTDQSLITHGTFFHIANEESLITNSSIHAGIRCKLQVRRLTLGCTLMKTRNQGIEDIEDDESVGFHFITSDDIDDHGVDYIVERIRKRVGDTPVYLRLGFHDK